VKEGGFCEEGGVKDLSCTATGLACDSGGGTAVDTGGMAQQVLMGQTWLAAEH